MLLCSIIIPVYNLAAITRRCLDQLLANPPATCDVELIVVDDGSRDSTPQVLAHYGDRIRVVTHRQNTGFSTACNDGAEIAQGTHLVFLNNDTLPLPGWLDALVCHAEHHPRAAVVGSKLLYPDGTIQHAGMAIDQDHHPQHIYLGFPSDHPAVNKSRRFQVVTGGCFLITRDAFDRAKGFDTAFRNGFEDVDLCLRLGELGYEVYYCHESVLFHLESITEGRCDHDSENHQLYHARWGHRVQVDDWSYYVDDGLIRISYSGSCPLQLHVEPLLALVAEEERRPETDRLLAVRSHQVRDLLKENIKLMVCTLQKPS